MEIYLGKKRMNELFHVEDFLISDASAFFEFPGAESRHEPSLNIFSAWSSASCLSELQKCMLVLF